MTPENQALLTLLIYCGFATLAVLISIAAWWVRKKKEEFSRKEHVLDMWALRIKEMAILIETVWHRANKQ